MPAHRGFVPEYVRCRRSGGSIPGRRTCPPDRSWPCDPRLPASESGRPAARTGWTRPCCGSDCTQTTTTPETGTQWRQNVYKPVHFTKTFKLLMLASPGYLLMTAVPLPGISRFTGQEVSCSLVLHPLRKPQQNSGVIILSVSRGTGGGTETRRGDNLQVEAHFNTFMTLNQLGLNVTNFVKSKTKNKVSWWNVWKYQESLGHI